MSNGNSVSKLAAEVGGMMESFLLRRCSEIEGLIREREFLKARVEELEQQNKELLRIHEFEMIRWKAICSEQNLKEDEILMEKGNASEKKGNELESKLLENGFNEGPENNNPENADEKDVNDGKNLSAVEGSVNFIMYIIVFYGFSIKILEL